MEVEAQLSPDSAQEVEAELAPDRAEGTARSETAGKTLPKSIPEDLFEGTQSDSQVEPEDDEEESESESEDDPLWECDYADRTPWHEQVSNLFETSFEQINNGAFASYGELEDAPLPGLVIEGSGKFYAL